ncbi:hypothetical protein ACWEVD_30115 [Nocardia thailandica]|uniref:HNH endonuclease n=1 Tax=Nocardia thailandica TaxID=257275 RepID=A0ABW6PXE7_9NOCA|nr:hypothetical protein [Nocardia thailandica]
MADTHAARAEQLADEANEALRTAIEQEDAGYTNAVPVDGIHGNRWARVQALQAQAQVHATLALAEEVARSRAGL